MKWLRDFRQRICDALKLLSCGRYSLYVFYVDKTDDSVNLAVARHAAEKYIISRVERTGEKDGISYYGYEDSIVARRQMIEAVLDIDNSVILQTRKYGGCYVAYDCQSQSEFDELLNQEIK